MARYEPQRGFLGRFVDFFKKAKRKRSARSFRLEVQLLEDRLTPVTPVVTLSTAAVPVNSSTIVINGAGFSSTPTYDSVAFSETGTGSVTATVTGTVTTASATQLTVSNVTGLVVGNLLAMVTVSGSSSGTPVQIASVIPVVNPSNVSLSASADTIIIYGSGFSSADTVAFSEIVTGSFVTGTATFVSSSQLTVSNLTGLVAGTLSATITDTVSGLTSGTPVQLATVSTDASLLSTLRDTYGFHQVAYTSALGPYDQKYHGLNDEWFQDRNNQWYALDQNGNLYTWQYVNNQDVLPLIATLAPADYTTPQSLFQAPVTLAQSSTTASVTTLATLNTLETTNGFYSSGSFDQAYHGLNDVWFQDRSANWWALTTAGVLEKWNGVVNGVDTFASSTTTLDPIVGSDPALLLQATEWAAVATTTITQVDQLQQTNFYHMSPNGNYYLNLLGMHEKWFLSGSGQWYIITPNGEIQSTTYNAATGGYSLSGILTTVAATVYDNPMILFQAAYTSTDQTQLSALREQYGFHLQFSGSDPTFDPDSVMINGVMTNNVMWLQDRDYQGGKQGWYGLTSSGVLVEWMSGDTFGPPLATLDPRVYEDPQSLIQASVPLQWSGVTAMPAAQTALDQLAGLNAVHGFHFSSIFYDLNYLSQNNLKATFMNGSQSVTEPTPYNEKWFEDLNGNFYIITPDGNIWSATQTGTNNWSFNLITNVDPTVYDNLSQAFPWLFNA